MSGEDISGRDFCLHTAREVKICAHISTLESIPMKIVANSSGRSVHLHCVVQRFWQEMLNRANIKKKNPAADWQLVKEVKKESSAE